MSNNRKSLALAVTIKQAQQLKLWSVFKGVSASSVVRDALDAYFEKCFPSTTSMSLNGQEVGPLSSKSVPLTGETKCDSSV